MASFQGGVVNHPDLANGPSEVVLPPVLSGGAVVATAGTPTTQTAVTLSHTGGTLTRRSSSTSS